jgi:hypothetical protein
MSSQVSISDFWYQGKAIKFSSIAGTVLSGDRTVSTDYYLTGGGGHVPPTGGQIAAPQLHATTTENQELWIRVPNGRDQRFALPQLTAPVLVGQSVVMIVGETQGSFRDVPTMLLNVSSQERHELIGVAGLLAFIDPPQDNPRVWAVWVVGGLVAFAAFLLANGSDSYNPLHAWFGIAILATPAISMFYVLCRRITFNKRFSTAQVRLRRHLDDGTSQFFRA